jgi:hypothetical protein
MEVFKNCDTYVQRGRSYRSSLATPIQEATAEVSQHEGLRAERSRESPRHGRGAVLRYVCLLAHVSCEGGLVRQHIRSLAHPCDPPQPTLQSQGRQSATAHAM